MNKDEKTTSLESKEQGTRETDMDYGIVTGPTDTATKPKGDNYLLSRIKVFCFFFNRVSFTHLKSTNTTNISLLLDYEGDSPCPLLHVHICSSGYSEVR